MKLLITGATGNVGRATLQSLLRLDRPDLELVAAASDPERARAQWPDPRIQWIGLDFTSVESVQRAFAGVDKLFLLRPPQLSDVTRIFRPVIDEAVRAGIGQIVFLSLQGVEHNRVTPHYKIEQLIRQAGIPFTFLRPSFFMQNLSTTHRREIAERREIFIPAGRGATNFVDVDDLGAVAARVLSSDEHRNRAYELTGPAALTYYEIAAILSRVLGRKITYRAPSLWAFMRRKRSEGQPWGFIFVMMALYTIARLGKAAGTTPELAQLLGRTPTTFEEFAERERQVWVTSGKKITTE